MWSYTPTQKKTTSIVWALYSNGSRSTDWSLNSKCYFLQDEITFWCHQVSAEGMKLGKANLKAIAELAPPKNYMGVRSFIGMTGFFRCFIKHFAQIEKPLNDILEGKGKEFKLQLVTLSPEALEAVHTLKEKFMTAPVLAFADFKKPFHLTTNTSRDGLGAVLSQLLDDGEYHLVAYASQERKGGEAKYHSSKLEFLALKWAVTEQFREYLQYGPFTIWTDNNPLTYILTMPNLDALGHSWVVALARYDMSLEYLKGTDNKVADALSWVQDWLDEEETKQILDKDTVRELLNWSMLSDTPRGEADNIWLIKEDQRNNQEVIVWSHQLVKQDKNFRNLMNWDWADAQIKDSVIRHVIDWIERPRGDNRSLYEYLKGHVPDFDRWAYVSREKELKVMDKLLYLRITAVSSKETLPVFVVPARKKLTALDGCHHCAGHQGWDHTLSLIRERFWWPGKSKTLLTVISNCGCCKQFEAKGELPGMQPIICTEPMELVHIDYIGMEVTVAAKEKPVIKNVLVVVDNFTWYVQAPTLREWNLCSCAGTRDVRNRLGHVPSRNWQSRTDVMQSSMWQITPNFKVEIADRVSYRHNLMDAESKGEMIAVPASPVKKTSCWT